MSVKNILEQTGRAARGCAPVSGSASEEICRNCDWWEIQPSKIQLHGWCDLFKKTTHCEHGKQCTGYMQRETPNDQAHPAAAGGTGGA